MCSVVFTGVDFFGVKFYVDGSTPINHTWRQKTGCLILLEILEIYWNDFSLLEILEIYWKLAKSPGNFLGDSKFLYFTVYR